MATAKVEKELAARGEGCLGRAHDDEPVFILRGQDLIAADLVEFWAAMAAKLGCPEDKVAKARELASQMRSWPNHKLPD